MITGFYGNIVASTMGQHANQPANQLDEVNDRLTLRSLYLQDMGVGYMLMDVASKQHFGPLFSSIEAFLHCAPFRVQNVRDMTDEEWKDRLKHFHMKRKDPA